MAGLVPAIHAYFVAKQGVDARHRAWHHVVDFLPERCW